MKIRKHKKSDREAIIQLLRLNTPKYFSPDEEKDLVNYLDKDADNYFVAEENNLILGCAGFNISDDGKTGGLAWAIVSPEAQGKGIGSALTYHRIKELSKSESIQIISLQTSQLTFKFYEKFNFEVQEIVKDYWGKGLDLYTMKVDIKLAGRFD